MLHKERTGKPFLYKQLKNSAAAAVFTPLPVTLKDTPESLAPAEIEINFKNQSSRVITANFTNRKPITLATILSERGIVEAACQKKLSCSTCVGEVRVDRQHAQALAEPTEDELDVTDMVAKTNSNTQIKRTGQIRAGCNIQLRPGARYTFTPIEGA